MPSSSSPRLFKEFLWIALIYLLVRLPWIFTVPMSQAPDEFAHYWVVQFVKSHLALPTAKAVAAAGPSAVYGSLPCFGYIPQLIIAQFGSMSQVALLSRFGSLLIGLVMIGAALGVGAELFAESRVLSIGLPLLVSFHPQMVFVQSYSNNDSTTSALTSLVVYLMVVILKRGLSMTRSMMLGGLLGWLMLCKYSGYAIFPVVAACLLLAAIMQGGSIARSIGCMATVLSLALFLSCWWFFRNFHEFGGDLLGTQTMYQSWATTFHRDLHFHMPFVRVVRQLAWWRMTFFSFWALFGYMTQYIWRPAYFVYLGFWAAALGGWIRSWCSRLTSGVGAGLEDADPSSRAIWGIFWLCSLINLMAMIWASTANLGGPQGRYLFTSEIPIMALTVKGLSVIGAPFGRYLVMGLIVFNMLVCVGSWLMLFHLYGWHAVPF